LNPQIKEHFLELKLTGQRATVSPEEKKKIQSLPHTLDEALDELERDHAFLTEGGVFPERLIEIWLANKREDTKKHTQMPTPMEFKMYYDL